MAAAAVAVIWAGTLVAAPPARLFTPQDRPTVGQDGKDVEWVPTPAELIDTMLTLADVTADDRLVDLGSGDGRTVIAAAERGAHAIGVEYDAGLVALSQERAGAAGVSARTTFVEADLFDVDLSDASVITMFLLPDLNLKLRPTLLDLVPGTRIVSNTWDMGDWVADETVQLDPCPGFCTALLWIVPTQVGGTWSDADGELVLDQVFQMVSGTVRRDEREIAISSGRLTGHDVVFRAGSSTYRGEVNVNADTILGTVTTGGRTVEWVAMR